jgi:hypothetical protein
MTSWYESRLDRQMREAVERGQFENLPGAGKPLKDRNELHDEDWWLKAFLEREKIDGRDMLPPLLALRREAEDLMRDLAKHRTEESVRTAVEELNRRIKYIRLQPDQGPTTSVVRTLDLDDVLHAWRTARSEVGL